MESSSAFLYATFLRTPNVAATCLAAPGGTDACGYPLMFIRARDRTIHPQTQKPLQPPTVNFGKTDRDVSSLPSIRMLPREYLYRVLGILRPTAPPTHLPTLHPDMRSQRAYAMAYPTRYHPSQPTRPALHPSTLSAPHALKSSHLLGRSRGGHALAGQQLPQRLVQQLLGHLVHAVRRRHVALDQKSDLRCSPNVRVGLAVR